MVKAKIDVDVSGVDRTIRKIKRDLHRGMEQSANTLVDNARKEARRVISEERAIFNSEVYSGFRDAETKNTGSNVRVKLYNDVEHAEVLEEGATFPAKGPPVAALLPWVARKMQWGSSFDPDIYGGADYFDGGDDGDDDGGGGSRNVSLEVAGEERIYPDNWQTYDPQFVEVPSRTEVFNDQKVELLNIEDESFVSGTVLKHQRTEDVHFVELENGQTVRVGPSDDEFSDPYRIIGSEKFDSLDDQTKMDTITGVVDKYRYEFENQNQEDSIREQLKTELILSSKDLHYAYNTAHEHYKIEDFDEDGVVGRHGTDSTGAYMKFGPQTTRSDVLHEFQHGLHKQLGVNRYTYPREKDGLGTYFNRFNLDGSNKTSKDWSLDEVLLQGTERDPIGLPDDGSFPNIVRERVSVGDGYEYTSKIDVNEILDPNTDKFSPGDRLKMDTPVNDDQTLELVGREEKYFEEGEDYAGEFVTAYQMTYTDSNHEFEMWVDDNGDFVNMTGIVIKQFAESPDDEVSRPEVELTKFDKYERLIEASNIAFMEMALQASQLDENEDVSNVNTVGNAYSIRAANEVWTTVSEVLRSQHTSSGEINPVLKIETLESLDERYPYLIEAWLEVFNPSRQVKKELERIGGYDDKL